jgi:hypothetical protein
MRVTFGIVFSLLLAAAPARAHHSFGTKIWR